MSVAIDGSTDASRSEYDEEFVPETDEPTGHTAYECDITCVGAFTIYDPLD